VTCLIGAGKSTLINALEGCTFVQGKHAGKVVVEIHPNSKVKPLVVTGHGSESDTLIPDPAYSGGMGVCLDCPGTNDTRNAAVNIANATNIAAFIHQAFSLRGVLCASFGSLTSEVLFWIDRKG
jgi:hypothetical protein